MSKNRSIIISLIASCFVFMKILSNSNIFLAAFLILVTYGLLKEENDRRINYILFFVSWVYVIKFNLDQSSLLILLFGIYCILTLFHILIRKKRFSMDLMLVFVLFLFYISFSLFQGIDESVLHIFEFVLGYLVLILSCISVTPNTSISNMFIHYSLGLLAGSIVRVLGYIIPTINSFILSMGRINTVSTGGILYTRFAGLDIDPNYYAIQVLLAISLNILVIFYVKRRRTLNIIITISLVVFGLLSFSKMYILTILILNILIVFMLIRKNIFNAFIYLTSILVLSIIILNQFGNYFYNAYLTRFVGQGNSLGDLTTGRTEIWNGYLQDILEHLKILFFGNGLANGFFNGELSHNMYILALYQIGIIGIIIYLILLVYTYKTLKISTSINNKIKISLNIIPLLMLIIPNFALDSFAMDYFPIQLFLVMMSLQAGKIDKKFEVLLNEN